MNDEKFRAITVRNVFAGETVHIERLLLRRLGNWDAYHGFTYGDLAWQAEKTRPVGINKKGAVIAGCNVDGALPEEMRRASTTVSCPPPAGDARMYSWEAMQGATVMMVVCELAGNSMLAEADEAYRRAVTWLKEVAEWPTDSDDGWQVPLINMLLGTNYPITGGSCGKGMGWTPWTHQ